MGLKPSELRDTTLFDFNCMAEAFNRNQKHDYEVMRMNAYLISMYTTISQEEKWKLHRLMRQMNRDGSRFSS